MKEVIVLIVLLSASVAVPVKNADVSYKVELEHGNITYESNFVYQNYSYRVETSDGTIKYEKGHLDNGTLVVEGGYEYTGDNNFKYAVTYLADKNGYRPKLIFDMNVGQENATDKATTTQKTTTHHHDATTEKSTQTTSKPKGKN